MILEEQYAETQIFCCRVGFCISVFVIVLHIYDVSLDENLPGNGVTSKYFRFVSGKDRSWCRDRSTRWLAESLREVRAYMKLKPYLLGGTADACIAGSSLMYIRCIG